MTSSSKTDCCSCCTSRDGLCRKFITKAKQEVRSLRFVVATFIIVFSIFIAYIIGDLVLGFYFLHLQNYGALYMETYTDLTKTDIIAILDSTTRSSLAVVDQLRTSDGFVLPSEDSLFDAKKWAQPFRTVMNYGVFPFINYGLFVDDGSLMLCYKQYLNGTEELVSSGGSSSQQQQQSRLEQALEITSVWSGTNVGNFSRQTLLRSRTASVCSMVSTFNVSFTNKTIVSHHAQYTINGSVIPINTSSPETNLVAVPDLDENKTDHYPEFYNGSKLSHLQFAPNDIVWSDKAIVLQLSESQKPFLNLAFSIPFYNLSNHFMGILGGALNTEILSDYLLVATKRYATPGTVGLIVDAALVIYASTISDSLPYYDTVEVPLNEPLPDYFLCGRASATLAAAATETTTLCIKNVFTYGFHPAAAFFRNYRYYPLPVNPNFNTDSQPHRSAIFDTTPDDFVYVSRSDSEISNMDHYYASFVKLPGSERASIGFNVAIAFFTPQIDFFTVLANSASIMIGIVAGVMVFSFMLTRFLVGYFLLRLPIVTSKVVKTSELMFDEENKKDRSSGKDKTQKHHGTNLNENLMKLHDAGNGRKMSNNNNVEQNESPTFALVDMNEDEENEEDSSPHLLDSNAPTTSLSGPTAAGSGPDDASTSIVASSTVAASTASSNIDDTNFSSVAEIYSLERAQVSLSRALNSMSKYLTKDVVRLLQLQGASSSSLKEALSSSAMSLQRKYATVLCSDIMSFTTLSESVSPALLSELLTLYFDKVVGIINDHSGTILLYVGDAVIAGWSAVFRSTTGHDEMHAALCALEMQRVVDIQPLKGVWKAKVQKKLSHRIGVNSGEVFAGVTGCSHRMTYSVSGPNYDFAGWLEAAGKKFGTLTSVSESVAQKIDTMFCMRRLMPLEVNGTLFAEGSSLLEENDDAALESTTTMIMSKSTLSAGSASITSAFASGTSNMYSQKSTVLVKRDEETGIMKTYTNIFELVGLLPASGNLNSVSDKNGNKLSRYQQIREFLHQKLPEEGNSNRITEDTSCCSSPLRQQQTLTKLTSFNRNFLKAADEEEECKKREKCRSKNPLKGLFSGGEEDEDGANEVASEELQSNVSEEGEEKNDDAKSSSSVSTTVSDLAKENAEEKDKMKPNNNTASSTSTPLIDLFTKSFLHRRSSVVASETEIMFADDFSSAVSLFANGQPSEALETFEQIQQDLNNSIFFYVPSTRVEMYDKLFGGSGGGYVRSSSANLDAEQMKQEEEIRVALEEQDETFREQMRETIQMPNRCSSCFITAHKSLKLIQGMCVSKIKEMKHKKNDDLVFAMQV